MSRWNPELVIWQVMRKRGELIETWGDLWSGRHCVMYRIIMRWVKVDYGKWKCSLRSRGKTTHTHFTIRSRFTCLMWLKRVWWAKVLNRRHDWLRRTRHWARNRKLIEKNSLIRRVTSCHFWMHPDLAVCQAALKRICRRDKDSAMRSLARFKMMQLLHAGCDISSDCLQIPFLFLKMNGWKTILARRQWRIFVRLTF